MPHRRDSFPILFGSQWRAKGLEDTIASIDLDALCAEYAALCQAAPRRSLVEKAYFVGHTGKTPTVDDRNRREEHYAIAMANLRQRWPRLEDGWFQILDYQVPLKARQNDVGIGKVDLLGVTNLGRLVIVELKVMGHRGSRGDSPPRALMQGLRYAAIVEADRMAIAGETERCFGIEIAKEPPVVQLLAPKAWWLSWFNLSPAGDWGRAFARLAGTVEAQTGVAIECMALEHERIAYGIDGLTPQLDHVPALYPVWPGEEQPIGDALSTTAERWPRDQQEHKT